MAMFGHILHVCEQLTRRVAPRPLSTATKEKVKTSWDNQLSSSTLQQQQQHHQLISGFPQQQQQQQAEVNTGPSNMAPTTTSQRTEASRRSWRFRLGGWFRRPRRGQDGDHQGVHTGRNCGSGAGGHSGGCSSGCTLGWSDLPLFCKFSKMNTLLPIRNIIMSYVHSKKFIFIF